MARKDLIPQNKRTKEEQKRIATMGGKASGVSRKRKKTMKELAQALLTFKPRKKIDQTLLAAAGFDPDDANNGALVVTAMVDEAVRGNVLAAKFVAELIGDGALHELKKQELALKKKALKAAEKSGVETSSAMQQLVETLKNAGD